MPKILFISFRWNDMRLHKHSSDLMMSKGFQRLGWEVDYYDYRDEYERLGPDRNNDAAELKIQEFQPDIIFVNKGEKISPRIIDHVRRRGYNGVVVFWDMDARKQPVKSIIEWSKVSDWVFHCKSGQMMKDYYQATKTPTSFLMAPYEPEFVNPYSFEEKDVDVSWFGKIYEPNIRLWDSMRSDILPKVKDLISAYGGCFGKDFVRGSKYYNALGRSKMSISIPAIDLSMYFSNRQAHIMGSGAVTVSYKFKDAERMFKDGHNIIFFKDAKTLRKKVQHHLNNTEQLREIHNNSLLFAQTYMHSDRVAEEILYVLSHGKSSYPFGVVINPGKICLR